MTRADLHIAGPTEEPERAGAANGHPPARALERCAPPTADTDPLPRREALLSHLDALYRFILVRVGFDESAADDVLQQTAEAALRDGDAAAVGSFEGWLRGVARNLVRRHWRDASRRSGAPLPTPNAGRRVLAALDSGCPSRLLEQRELSRALLWAIASLPAADQWLLYAVYRAGRTRGEIADELGCTQKGVEMRLYRTRAHLRERLAACGEEA